MYEIPHIIFGGGFGGLGCGAGLRSVTSPATQYVALQGYVFAGTGIV